MSRVLSLAYGTVVYAIFFATFLYAIGFIGNFAVPTTLDGAATAPLANALAVNLALLAAFAIQHSVMARPTFKRWWTTIIPQHLERSTYTLLSSVALIVMFVFWQPMGGTIWSVTDPVGSAVLYALFGFGWGLVLISTFLINHFDLFGLRQVWLYFRGREYTPLRFSEPWLYRKVRHPLYLGWLFAFWATPTMTTAHLLFAVMTTAYIFIAIQLEERNLIDEFGEGYRSYKRRVPMIIPGLRGRKATAPSAAEANAA